MEPVQKQPAAPAQEGQYLILFGEGDDGLHWYDYLFTRKHFRHAFLLYWDEWTNRYLMFDWRIQRLELSILFPFEVAHILKECQQNNLRVVKFTRKNPERKSPFFFGYCSNMLARFLGLGSPLILTPYGLYRRLLRAGATDYDWRLLHEAVEAQEKPGAAAAGREPA